MNSPAMQASRPPRRHDLDALRAVAMLLGIALHASLAYVPGIPWPVQDSRPARWLGLLFLAIHGFRMPLFFLLSGFFTAMLWRDRGATAMLAQRARRVLFPLVIGCFTLLPAFAAVVRGPASPAADRAESPAAAATDLVVAIRRADTDAAKSAIDGGADPAAPDAEFRMQPITLAALVGDVDVARVLVDAGADPGGRNADGRTPLHAAAFAGRTAMVAFLLESGADPSARSAAGDRPFDATRADAGATAFIAEFLRIDLAHPEALDRDRAAIRAMLADRGAGRSDPPQEAGRDGLAAARQAYRGWLASPAWGVPQPPGGRPKSLFLGDTFNYLWFLWFLCWYAVGFAALATLARALRLPPVPDRLVASPAALLWTVPLTLLPQAFMGLFTPALGPDTSVGLLPQPHVLGYYAVFFGYGAILQGSEAAAASVGRRWPIAAAVALLVCFPAGLATLAAPAATALPQALYAWLMSFAAIGFFRWLVPRESVTWRYLSDSAYWLYLAHLPLLVVVQRATRDWPLPGTVKFLLVCGFSTAVLLASYQLLVRHTWLGIMLNGPRCRGPATRSAIGPGS
jgi:peptidoglycan/LPS O-acetylase OafA/YrhL